MADFVALRGTHGDSGSDTGTVTVTPTGTCVAGNTLIAAVGIKDVNTYVTASDTQGNLWQQATFVGFPPGAVASTALFSCPLNIALAGSDTITFVLNGPSATTVDVVVGEFTGIVFPHDTEAPNDVSINTAGSGSPWSIGPSPTTTFPAELAVAAFFQGGGGSTFTPGSGWSLAGSVVDTNGVRLGLEYKLLTATGQQTATATFSNSGGSWAASLVTFITDTPQNAPPSLLG